MGKTTKLKVVGTVMIAALALTLAGMAFALAGTAQADSAPATAPAAERQEAGRYSSNARAIQPRQAYTCSKPKTSNGHATGNCSLQAGVSARLRADCKYAIDRYSRWKSGEGYREFRTINPCPRGIRGGIWEVAGLS